MFSCDDGYVLYGVEGCLCGPDGKWKGFERPRCIPGEFRVAEGGAGEGVLTLAWYTYMCLPFGALFREISYSDREFSLEMKAPKLHKLGVFWANYCKKHPILTKLGGFLSKMGY